MYTLDFGPEGIDGTFELVTSLPICHIQGYLAHKKYPPCSNLQWGCTQGHMMVIEGEFL